MPTHAQTILWPRCMWWPPQPRYGRPRSGGTRSTGRTRTWGLRSRRCPCPYAVPRRRMQWQSAVVIRKPRAVSPSDPSGRPSPHSGPLLAVASNQGAGGTGTWTRAVKYALRVGQRVARATWRGRTLVFCRFSFLLLAARKVKVRNKFGSSRTASWAIRAGAYIGRWDRCCYSSQYGGSVWRLWMKTPERIFIR